MPSADNPARANRRGASERPAHSRHTLFSVVPLLRGLATSGSNKPGLSPTSGEGQVGSLEKPEECVCARSPKSRQLLGQRSAPEAWRGRGFVTRKVWRVGALGACKGRGLQGVEELNETGRAFNKPHEARAWWAGPSGVLSLRAHGQSALSWY